MNFIFSCSRSCANKLNLVFLPTGPAHWHKDCPIANGKNQSPIDLINGEVKYDSGLKPLTAKYVPFSDAKFLNNGHSVQFQPSAGNGSGKQSFISICTRLNFCLDTVHANLQTAKRKNKAALTLGYKIQRQKAAAPLK